MLSRCKSYLFSLQLQCFYDIRAMLLLRENKPLFMQPILCNKVRKGLLENC